MAGKPGRKRVFGELEARKSADTQRIVSWRARYRGPDLARHSRTFGDKMAAEAWLNAERLLIERDDWTPPRVREAEARRARGRALTLAEWARRSVDGKTLRPSTRYRYERILATRILPELGDVPLAQLTRLDVTDWYTRLRAQLAREARARTRGSETHDGRGAAFVAYQVLSSILADAVDHELLDASPAKVKGALNYDPVHQPVVLTPDQMWQLSDLMPGYLAALVPLAAVTGLRNGELRALQRRHLRLDDPWGATVAVRGSTSNYKHAGRYNEIGEPKTKAGRRDVAVPSFVVPILREHLAAYGGPDPEAMVFPGRRGGVLDASVVQRSWHQARRQVEGLDNIHLHDLRHTALTWAARSGATLAELMTIAGHSNPTVALRYQHAGQDERMHAIAERIGEAFHDELAARRARRAGDRGGETGLG